MNRPHERQLPLAVRLDDSATFANFYAGPESPNRLPLHALTAGGAGQLLYLWGEPGAGRSHLLQAAVREQAGQALYLPLAELAAADPGEVLAGLERCALLALDDLHSVCARPAWAVALFHLYNRLTEAEGRLLVSAACAPAALDCALEDLRSRLAAMQVHRLHALDDAGKREALIVRARNRGLVLSAPVAVYLLTHFPRGIGEQMAFLERLDRGSLVAKKGLSLGLVKQILGG